MTDVALTDVELILAAGSLPRRLIAASKDKSATAHSALSASIELATSCFAAFATAA